MFGSLARTGPAGQAQRPEDRGREPRSGPFPISLPPAVFPMSTTAETHRFEAEVQRVLELVIHSLYAQKEIFLRELVSNASDALDKLRFEALTDDSLMEQGEELGIALAVDAEAGTLAIADNGIGMDREELVANLGTIASSGTRRFLEAMKAQKKEGSPDLIGQFGVGFYSAFMVAKSVTVETRKAGGEEGWRWHSAGDGEYSLESAEGLSRGTLITLELRDDMVDEEEGSETYSDLVQEHRLREIVKRYSDFVEYPIQMEVEREEVPTDDEGKPIEGAAAEKKLETVTLNSRQPLWSRPKADISEEEYQEFYSHISHDWSPPLETVHFRMEGTLEFTALLYLPGQRGMDLFDPEKGGSRISLYVRRVMIMKECEELLPKWLRFVKGVVESNDLPLNVSRETLQASPRVRQIKKRLVKKVLETLSGILEEDRERYTGFWKSFGLVLKEGIYYGEDEDQRISSLCLFETTQGDERTTLAEYVERMPEGQEEIFVLTGDDRARLLGSPHLEALREKGYECLLLTDPVDEFLLERFTEFDGKTVRSLDQGDVDLSTDEEKKSREEKQEEFKDLLGVLQSALDEDVSEVRFSSRLKDSPAVLVAGEGSLPPQLERMLRAQGQEIPKQKRVLELNPDHALVAGLKKLHDVDAGSPRLASYAELLHGQAVLAEGGALADPGRFGQLVTELMVGAVSS